MINIRNLSVNFTGKQVLKDISIGFAEKKIYGIVGLNGAGKTTFFNAFAGVIKFPGRNILFNEQPVTYRELAFLETVNFFYSGITGREYLGIFKQTNREYNQDALQEFLRLPLDELIETYSTGMKKKLALLAILKQDKPIYLFDEPFNSLDLETNKFLELIITALKEKGKTVFLSSHIIEPLLSVCDKIYYLENGQFMKSFDRHDYHKIDEELFRKLRIEAEAIIKNSI